MTATEWDDADEWWVLGEWDDRDEWNPYCPACGADLGLLDSGARFCTSLGCSWVGNRPGDEEP